MELTENKMVWFVFVECRLISPDTNNHLEIIFEGPFDILLEIKLVSRSYMRLGTITIKKFYIRKERYQLGSKITTSKKYEVSHLGIHVLMLCSLPSKLT